MRARNAPVVVGVVPARYASSRWPGKALALVAGKPLVMWAWQALAAAPEVDRCIVATDDARIARWAALSGVPFAMTSPDRRNGTERVAEVAEQDDARGEPAAIYVNVQADQVGLEPRVVSRLVNAFREHPGWQMATLGVRSAVAAARVNPDRVLVHAIADGTAAAFWRGGPTRSEDDVGAVFRHIGVYVYRREALREYGAAEPSRDELAASLEQLRGYALGWKIGLLRVRSRARSLDRPEDVDCVRVLSHAKAQRRKERR